MTSPSTRTERLLDRHRRRRERTRTPFPPLWLVGIVVFGGIAIVLLTSLVISLPWWQPGGMILLVLYFGHLMLRARRMGDFVEMNLPERRAPAERSVIRPECWESLARRLRFSFRGGRRPEMEGVFAFVPMQVRLLEWPWRMTVVRARMRETPEGDLRLRPTGEGGETFEECYRVSGDAWTAARMLPNDVRARFLELRDLELEVGLLSLSIRTRGFEGDEDRLLAILGLASRVARLAQTGVVDPRADSS